MMRLVALGDPERFAQPDPAETYSVPSSGRAAHTMRTKA